MSKLLPSCGLSQITSGRSEIFPHCTEDLRDRQALGSMARAKSDADIKQAWLQEARSNAGSSWLDRQACITWQASWLLEGLLRS